MNGGDIPKQRGIYSEILTTEDTENLKLVSTIGPSIGSVIQTNVRQKMPRALGIRRRAGQQQSPDKSDAGTVYDQNGKILGKNYFRDPEVNLGFYSKKREGVADVDPKVMEPFIPIPGKPPRKVVIDRQRKLFASLNIEELLLELGIDYKNPEKTQADWLPLEPFDDTEYDCRLPEEWIQYGSDENDHFNPIPGKGLWRDDEGKGYWRPVLINNYETDRGIFTGFWDDNNEYCELTRINLLFNAEDPRIFAQRVAQAHQERIYADSQIRYNFFIDNMPNQELPELDTEQISRILHMACAPRFLQKKNVDTNNILIEVNLDFGRTMNLIIMEKNMDKTEEQLKQMIPANLMMPPKASLKETPYFGMVPIPQHDFPEQFSNFCFNSLYIKEEVIKAMVDIRAECNQLLLDNRLFNVEIQKTLRVEEFKQIQSSSISQIKFNTQDQGWVGRLEKIIRASFTDVGKGWFNIHETSKETYEFGKLKKFLTLVNFMMQDTVLQLCKLSVNQFVEFMLKFIPYETIVESTSSVRNNFPKKQLLEGEENEEEQDEEEMPESQMTQVQKVRKELQKMFSKNKDPDPLFILDLVLKPNQLIPQYSTEPKEIVSKIMEVFDEGIECLLKIPQLEPILLKHLFKTHGKKMVKAPIRPIQKPVPPANTNKKSLPDENTWLWEAYFSIRQTLEQSIEPLYEYVKTFSKFEAENKLNPDRFVRSLDEGDSQISAEALKSDINEHRKEESRLKNEIPESIVVSIFQVNCKDIRNLYVGKHSNIIEKEVKLIAQKAKETNYTLVTKFDEINERMRRPPKNIEELTETKKYIQEIPIKIEALKQDIKGCMEVYEILDEFNFEFTGSDLDNKWYLFGAPKRVVEIIESQSSILEKQKEQFVKQMETEQEEFEETLDNLGITVGGFHSFDDLNKYEEIAINVESVNQRLQECIEQSRLYNQREFLVGKEQKDYSRLQQMAKEFLPYSNLWLTTRNWFKYHHSWLNDPWDQLNAVELDNVFESSNKTIQQVSRFFKEKDFPKIMKIADTMKKNIDEFKPYVPLAVALRKDGMKDRHWDQISDKVKFDIRPEEGFTLTTVIDKGMLKYVDICEEVGERAYKEFHIEKSLTKMMGDWKDQNFMLPQFKSSTTNFIAGFDDSMQMLDEHIVTTQAMQFSPFKKPFEKEIEEWNAKLMLVSDTLEEWVKCQGQWMYLQPIFDSPDIVKQLPSESKRFKSVDSTWRHILNQTKQSPNILLTCSKEGLKEKFQEANKNLEIVQKGLADYLEKKRSVFARFYFLSNDELLEILSQTKEVRNVRPHLRKVFEAMADLEFKDDDTIWAMFSGEGEKVNFVRKIDPKDRNVEFWMGDVEKMMQNSVRAVLLKSIEEYLLKPRNEWIVQHPGQCVLNGSQVHWTQEVEEAIKSNGRDGVKDYLLIQQKQLNNSVLLVRQKLSKMATITINALIVIDVHAKDVVAKLYEEGVEDTNAFEWISQLRYYWENDDCYVKCVQTNFPYGYEYLGNSLRLVITPLTDKCYMTLMGALSLNLGGAPAGPAGTGKTESTKDLAKALAKQCVVFNCSDGMDHIMVAKFFKGLASAGAWACFDEFNRINIEVLSVIAEQLLVLFRAKANNEAEIVFEESLIKMKPTFCVFITMNPGYAGRTELPDNLKALFRPVAMMVPDYALIGEIMLYSFGFLTGRDLARKMVTTFKLSSEQLSSQDHYDYGMRAVRSVINAAGLLKRANQDMNEDQLLLRALRDVNVPKFLKDDLPLFENIILDLFPGVERPQVNYGDLFKAIDISSAHFNLQPIDQFVMKIIQLYDTIQVRHGLMLVGPTGGGKTCNYKVLQHAMSSLAGTQGDRFNKVHVDILNPKSITMGQLYGYVDPQTTEWMDGVLAKLVVDCTKDESPDLHWVMFDGPVDAIWIENMNTVLDDNKKLCLNSGQIITLTSRMTMMFEVEDLAVASPATVSRCGMVYLEPASLTLKPLIKSWLNAIPPKVKENRNIIEKLASLFENLHYDACYYVRKQLPEPVKTVDNNITQSLMRILDTYFVNYVESEIKKVGKDDISNLETVIPQLFIFALIWSLGTTTTLEGRIKFDQWFRERINQLGVAFPEDRLVYDYKFNFETKEWVYWMETISEYQVDIKMSYNEIVVPTVDSIRMKYFLKTLVMNGKHCLTPGPTGTGKSVNIQELLTYELPEEFLTLAVTFSAQTSANQIQDYLDEKFEKRRKGVYGPPVGSKYVIFIDDLNMPKKEEYGAQPPLELLRQWMDHKGWYDRKSKEKPFNVVQDIVLISAMGPPGGGRSEITQRLQRHFNIMTYTELQESSIHTIFSTIISAYLYNFTQDIKQSLNALVEMTLRVYDNVLNGPLKPTPNKSHYTFNLRDISRIFQGLCNANNKLVTQPVHLVRMWIHENQRVFGDRLIDQTDREWITNLVNKEGEKTYELTMKQIYNVERLIYGDFMGGIDVDNRIYGQISDLSMFIKKIEDFLEDYNNGVKNQMKLVMFLDACEHVSRIERILRQPLGNAFLLGVGGSGRQSLSRLATYVANYKIFQIEVVKGYSMNNWREDVKKALMQAGVDNKSTSFLFVDTQIISEQMLEDINNILNSGDVPNLYKLEDLDPINKVGKLICMEKNLQITKMNMFQGYLGRVKKNIHMIIAMSPLGEIFRSRIRKFPSLVNCCTIDWFMEWPEEALLGVGRGQVTAEDLQLGVFLDGCVEMFKEIHQSVEKKSKEFLESLRRKNYVTPTSFLELLNMYKTILFDKRKEIEFQKNRLLKGLSVLEEAAIEIAKLKVHIDQMTPQLEITKKDVEKTMIQLSQDRALADEEKEIVAKDEAEATQQESEAEQLKTEAEYELSKASPLLDEAAKVLKELKKDDFYVISAIKKPTPAVVLGMELSCHMMDLKPKKTNIGKIDGDTNGYFDMARQNLLNNPGKFMQNMVDYDKENIQESTVKRVNAILNSEDFTLDKVRNASQALVAIHKWVSAMMSYHQLLKIVNPKRLKVAEMNEKLSIVRANLIEKRKKLREVEEKIESLERMFRDKKELEASLQSQIDDCYKKLERANKIITGLEGEKTRWTLTVGKLDKEYGLLIGNCLVGAGMVAYAGAFTASFRQDLEQLWREKIKKLKIDFYDNVSMKQLLEDPVKIKIWTAASLPNDNLSIENAIIMFKSRRWPLMIDPQNQANKFIKNLGKEEAETALDIFKMSDGQLLRNLELGIQFGKWVLIENVGEEMDPALEPILLKQVDKSGQLRLGEKSIPYNQSFRFFMTTTIPNPHYSPETSVKVTILNFAITPFGLEEQMLNQFVSQEMPELQKKKDTIVQQNAQSAKALREIEDKILEGLTKNAKIADILEDDELIKVLDESKKTSDEINQRMKESEITEKQIDQTREIYRPVAYRASILFFTIIDLAVVDPMYQYSLQWFANLFGQSVDNSQKSTDAEVRIKALNDHFTLSLYENICRSLFEKHKLLFSFILTVKVLQGYNEMDLEEWRYYLAGPTGEIEIVKNPTTWLGDLEWAEVYKQLYCMAKIPKFKGIDQFFIQNNKEFQKIFDALEPHNMPLPGDWNNKLNTFQKLILLKSLRPDKMFLAIQNFIVEKLSREFIEPPTFNLSKSFKDSSVTIPLIFVLSPGSDPVADFQRYAEDMNMSKKLVIVSLGKGQEKKAENMINESATRGAWVLLMNCHLASSFMPKLENLVDNLDDSNHRDFRLWLTSMPNKDFPVSTLQNSVKMTLEPPSGLRLNILRTYEALDPKEFEDVTKPEAYKKLLFGFSFFHAIVQDRRKFGPIGWNIPYEFTNEDLTVSRRQLKIFIQEYEKIPYKVLNYIGAEINYGGRVTDDKDSRLIITILRTYVNAGILEDGFKFSTSGIYYSPPAGEKEDYIDYIKSLPLNPSPEAFGLHENAEITTSQNNTRLLLEQILSMQPRSSAGGGKTREQIIGDMAAFIQTKTAEAFDLESVGQVYPTSYEESMNTVLFQECVRYNRLLVDMKITLVSVQKALKGEVVMSEELEKMSNSIFDNMVPKSWQDKGFLSLKPLASWIQDLNDRIFFLTNWIRNGTPKVFWISGFFFPQAFLTGTLQNYARKHVIAIDRLQFKYDLIDTKSHKDITEKPVDGCYIYGMYLEGCKWDFEDHILGDSDPKKLFIEVPMIQLVPQMDRVTPKTGIYNCPVYKVLSRSGTLSTTGHSTNFVMIMEFPTKEIEDKWIKAGVAGFLALRY